MLYEKDIPLALKIEFPDIVLYCTEESQDKLVKILKALLERYGSDRFCREVAATFRVIKNDQYSDKLSKIKEKEGKP